MKDLSPTIEECEQLRAELEARHRTEALITEFSTKTINLPTAREKLLQQTSLRLGSRGVW